jgi:transposase
VIWRFRTNSQWREMPHEFGPWPTVYGRFRVWRDAGVFTALAPRGPAALWGSLAAATLLSACAVATGKDRETRLSGCRRRARAGS